jgi:polyprenyldihydroxybenzoate methyltransferase / 3-demethylubiquinol 3-O-methyltransferase
MGANTLGVDASESNIAIASLHSSADPKLSSESTASSKQGSLSYLHSSAETLLSLPKRYDIVCSMEVLEHVDNPAAFLSTCAELLKVLEEIFSFPRRNSFLKFLDENSLEVIYFYQQSQGRR